MLETIGREEDTDICEAHILDIDMNLKSDRELYQTAQKLLAILMSLGQACVYVASGLYGPPSELGYVVIIMLGNDMANLQSVDLVSASCSSSS
jgi:preprotein translocase subunit SecY